MTDCYIYDTVRTPRGKGKKNGTLHEVTALELATQVLNNIKDRTKIDTADVDDVVSVSYTHLTLQTRLMV